MGKKINLRNIAEKSCIFTVLTNPQHLQQLPIQLRILVGNRALKVLNDVFLDISSRNNRNAGWNEKVWKEFLDGESHPLVPASYRVFDKERRRNRESARKLVKTIRKIGDELLKSRKTFAKTVLSVCIHLSK